MFILALLIGLYAYVLFFLGISNYLYKGLVAFFTVYYWGTIFMWKRKDLLTSIRGLPSVFKRIKKDVAFIFVLLLLHIGINVIGVLGPELAFDALWYHLTLPKLWLTNHVISFIPGGLLYYSAMPKLGELLFIPGLVFGDEILVKAIHLSFGLLTCLALYKLQRKFFNTFFSLLGVIIFYANLVVSWESISAYIDLIRTFFEVMALWGFVTWWKTQQKKWLILSALMVGFAITTKLLAIGSLFIFSILSIWILWRKKKNLFIGLLIYWIIAMLIPLPWFILSYLHTGNIVYPFFSDIYRVTPEPLSFTTFLIELWVLFTNAADPISPIYLIFLPLIIIYFSKFRPEIKVAAIYSLFAIFVWYITPRTGGGRFILPYLPAFSLLCTAVLYQLRNNKIMLNYAIGTIIFISCITLAYRSVANSKYLPVILGEQTKQEFLKNNLNFSFGDFYDSDGYFLEHIISQDTVLLYGFHNLYYVNFPFIDSSWVKPGDRFTYIATQNTILPEKYKNWKLVYRNDETMIKLYKSPLSGHRYEKY